MCVCVFVTVGALFFVQNRKLESARQEARANTALQEKLLKDTAVVVAPK